MGQAGGEQRAKTMVGNDLLRPIVQDAPETVTKAPADMLAGLRVAGRRIERGDDAAVPGDYLGRVAEGAPDSLDRRIDAGAEAYSVQVGLLRGSESS